VTELQLTGQTDERGNLLPSNSATSGRGLEQMAAAACLSAYSFARQFRAATGLPPNQSVLARRVERAQQLLQRNRDRSLAELAAGAGFSRRPGVRRVGVPDRRHSSRQRRYDTALADPGARFSPVNGYCSETVR
jgi:AraC-like DNA-binding protein